jgi:hypothetical protein
MIYYVALPLVRIDGGLAPREPAECPHPPLRSDARKRCQLMR